MLSNVLTLTIGFRTGSNQTAGHAVELAPGDRLLLLSHASCTGPESVLGMLSNRPQLDVGLHAVVNAGCDSSLEGDHSAYAAAALERA